MKIPTFFKLFALMLSSQLLCAAESAVNTPPLSNNREAVGQRRFKQKQIRWTDEADKYINDALTAVGVIEAENEEYERDCSTSSDKKRHDPCSKCPPGPTGPPGYTGPNGPTGSAGPAGPAGPTGSSGGITGPTGPTGSTGPAGPTGPASGFTGAIGPVGAAGATGSTGATGPSNVQLTHAGFSLLVSAAADLGYDKGTALFGWSPSTSGGITVNSSGVFTIASSGDYLITCYEWFLQESNDGNGIALFVNGVTATHLELLQAPFDPSMFLIPIGGMAIVHLNAGDEVTVVNESPGVLTVGDLSEFDAFSPSAPPQVAYILFQQLSYP